MFICAYIFVNWKPMNVRQNHSHQSIQKELLRRIHSGEWRPGERIPGEVALAAELGCARTTVNRALRQMAETGIVERKRRSGTHVALTPIRRATLQIPIIRQEVEERGGVYKHLLLTRQRKIAPPSIRARLGLNDMEEMLHLQTLHLADNQPHMFEDRWVNFVAAPSVLQAPLEETCANEWLVRNVPYSRGDISFSACSADGEIAEALEILPGSALFLVERTTWMNATPITTLKMFYPEGFRFSTTL